MEVRRLALGVTFAPPYRAKVSSRGYFRPPPGPGENATLRNAKPMMKAVEKREVGKASPAKGGDQKAQAWSLMASSEIPETKDCP